MAQKLDVAPSFLSAIELGKKKMPYEWNLKIRSAYSLTPKQEDELDEVVSQSEKAVILDFEEASPAAKKPAVSFRCAKRQLQAIASEQKKHPISI